MAGVRHEGVDTTVGSVSPATTLLGSLASDVLDDEELGVEVLGLTVGFGVLQELKKDLGALLGPATLSVLEGLSLSGSTAARVVATEGDALLVGNDVLQEALGITKLAASDGGASLEGVLEVHTQVHTHSLAALGGDRSLTRVLHHLYSKRRQKHRDGSIS